MYRRYIKLFRAFLDCIHIQEENCKMIFNRYINVGKISCCLQNIVKNPALVDLGLPIAPWGGKLHRISNSNHRAYNFVYVIAKYRKYCYCDKRNVLTQLKRDSLLLKLLCSKWSYNLTNKCYRYLKVQKWNVSASALKISLGVRVYWCCQVGGVGRIVFPAMADYSVQRWGYLTNFPHSLFHSFI